MVGLYALVVGISFCVAAALCYAPEQPGSIGLAVMRQQARVMQCTVLLAVQEMLCG